MKIKDDGTIDQEYYEMVKAKLSLLGKEWKWTFFDNSIVNYRMNVLKSAFRLSKADQSKLPTSTLYEEVKSWDQARARILQNHIKVVELVMEALDNKVGQVDKYIDGLDKLMSARIEEIVPCYLFRPVTAKME